MTRINAREARMLGMLAAGHSITTAADGAAMGAIEVAQLRQRIRLELDQAGRLRNPAVLVHHLADQLNTALDAIEPLRAGLIQAVRPATALSAKELGVDPSDIRAWSASIGVPVPGAGRIPAPVLAAYATAHRKAGD